MHVAAMVLLHLLCLDSESFWAVYPCENIAMAQGSCLSMYLIYFYASNLSDQNGNTVLNTLGFKIYENLFRFINHNMATFQNTWIFDMLLPTGYTELVGDMILGLAICQWSPVAGGKDELS